MHQLSLHYAASHEINSTWLAEVLLFIFLPIVFGLAVTNVMQRSNRVIQTGYVPYGVLVSSSSSLLFVVINCSVSQTGPVKQRNWKFWMWATTSLWSFHQGQQTFFLYKSWAFFYGELTGEKEAVLFQSLYSLCTDKIHLVSLCSIENTLYSNVGRNWLPNQLLE